MTNEMKRRVDSFIRIIIDPYRQGQTYYYDERLGLCETMAADVVRECRQCGVRVSKREVEERVSDFLVGVENAEESKYSVS